MYACVVIYKIIQTDHTRKATEFKYQKITNSSQQNTNTRDSRQQLFVFLFQFNALQIAFKYKN